MRRSGGQSRWGRRESGGTAVVAGFAIATAQNAAVHRVLPGRVHLPANLVLAFAELVLARSRGATADDMGLSPHRFPASAAMGCAVGLLAATAVGAAAALPLTATLFDDELIVEHDKNAARYEALIRIPIATALAEELVFRAALPSLVSGGTPSVLADVLSSVWFGLWHVLPTLKSLDTNAAGSRLARSSHGRATVVGVVVGVVGATTLAGLGFAWLRRRTGSIVAPVIVHAAVNLTAFAAVRARSSTSKSQTAFR